MKNTVNVLAHEHLGRRERTIRAVTLGRHFLTKYRAGEARDRSNSHGAGLEPDAGGWHGHIHSFSAGGKSRSLSSVWMKANE